MQFETGHIYHIYNQGNNRQKIFFERENYLFFLRKMRTYLLPYGDILAYCLMPNHFHWMILVKATVLTVVSEGFAQSETLANNANNKTRTLNDSIGIMLRSYTIAINKEQQRSGSLFRKQTKAECLTLSEGVSPSFYNTTYGTSMRNDNPEKEYPQVCFNYIHQNPVNAGLAKKTTDWAFSSAQDYTGIRDGTLINKSVAKKYVDY